MSAQHTKLWAVAVGLGLFSMTGMAGERVRVVNEGDIRDRWVLADGVELVVPGYPATVAVRGDNVCMAMGYAIAADGTTSDFRVLKTWADSTGGEEPEKGFWDAFAQASAGALSQWKFEPRPGTTAPQPVYTVATMHFMGKEATDAAGLRSRCAISDLAALMRERELDHTRRGQDKKALLSQRPGDTSVALGR